MLLDRFEQQVRISWIRHKFTIDTSDLTPEQLFGHLPGGGRSRT